MSILEHPIASATGEQNRAVPTPVLCVDLDGTLIKTDLLWECVILLLKTRPWALLLVPLWLVQGRAVLKRKLAERVALQPETLPYRSDVVEVLTSPKEKGPTGVLVTAADKALAEEVATHLGIFAQVYGSEDGRNLKGRAKAALMESKFGRAGFEYVGDTKSDLAVWKAAHSGYVVGDPRLARQASA